MKLVYEINTGKILFPLPDSQDISVFFSNHSQEFVGNISFFIVSNPSDIPKNLIEYFIRDEQFIKYSETEIKEIRKYRRVLTSEERLLKTLKPDSTEVEKAKKIIDVLDILQDVGLIKLADTALIDVKLIDAYTSLTLSGSSILNKSDRIGVNQKLVPTKYKIEVNTKVTEKTNKEKK